MPVATPESDPLEMLTVNEVADRMRVAPNTVLRWIRDGHLVAHQLPGKRTPYRIRVEDWEAFLDSTKERGIRSGLPE